MHTPAGFEMREGVAHAIEWTEIIFNPSMPYRLTHVLLASGLTVSFLMAGLSAFRLLVGDTSGATRLTLKTAVCLAAILIPVQIFVGDLHGLNTLEHQPQKIAAMEGNWETRSNVPLLLFALPDEQTRENEFEVGIPNGASLVLTHRSDGIVPGLNDYVTDDGAVMHPPVAPVFWSFRIMVGVGVLMLFISWFTLWRFWRHGKDAVPRPLLVGFVAMTFSGWVATLAGWYTTEIGRQPWLVDGVLSTSAAVADVPAPMVLSTLLVYLTTYVALTFAYVSLLFYLARKAARGEEVQALTPTSGAAEVQLVPGE